MAIEFTEEWYQNIPILDKKLSEQLFQINPSCRYGINWFPCSVNLKNGKIIERVYLIDADFERKNGWLSDGVILYSLNDVIEINESPYRLPHRIWNKLSNSGETAMGYLAFTLKFKGLLSAHYASGGYLLDFFDMPKGKSEADIIEVIPHVPRETKEKRFKSADYGYIYYRKE